MDVNMNLVKLYHKLPKIIKNSEKMTLFLMRIYKFIIKRRKSEGKPNQFMNFLFKSTNIEATGTVRNIQLLFVELLRFFDNICDKYGIDYWIAYGTLIGAVRHEGFIPWDDDCDICMMRKDYTKLIDVLPYEIKKYDLIQDMGLARLIGKNENFFKDTNNAFNSIADKHYKDNNFSKSSFLQIAWLKPYIKLDIFPFDYVREESIDYYNKNYAGHKYYFRVLFNDDDFSFFEELKKQSDKVGITVDETEFIAESIDGSIFDDFGVFDKNIIFPLKTIKFEGYEFKCPNQPHVLLERCYGPSYMDIPSNMKLLNYNKLNESLFNSKQELNDAFAQSIVRLKEINDNFD